VTLIVAGCLSAGLIVGGAALPVPYVKLAPGPVTNTLGLGAEDKPLIRIDGATTYPTTGKLDLTTVSEYGGPGSRLDLGDAVRGWLDPTVAIVPEELLYPPDITAEQAQEEAATQMSDSQQNAKVAALRYLGHDVPTLVTVASLTKNSASEGKLEAGDVILSVDGTPVSNPDELRAAINKVSPGQTVLLGVQRTGQKLDVKVTTSADPSDAKRPLIGIVPGTDYVLPFKIDIDLRDVGGPSAGLMFALGIIDKLTPESLTNGKTIAGTGTIDADGSVGPIGGIQQKMVGAKRNGATVFFVPAGNCSDAKGAKPKGLQLVKVSKLSDAVHALETLRSGGTNLPTC
jgi:PDZ domain-containing protein